MNLLSRRSAGSLLVSVFSMAAAQGCSKLFTEAPKKLYRVTPKSTFPPGLPHVTAQLIIDIPSAPAGLDTERIALADSPLQLDYFADAQWTDRAPVVVQTALLESFENSGVVAAVDREPTDLRADFVLKTELRHFEAAYDSRKEPPRVWVGLNVRLVDAADREIIGQRSVTQQVPAEANDVPHVVLAFDEALGAAMKEIVVWAVTSPALRRPPAASSAATSLSDPVPPLPRRR